MKTIFLLIAMFMAACHQGATSPGPGDGGEPDASGDDGGILQDRDPGGDDAAFNCETHADCPCPEGICLSTGVCWCPPCETDEDCAPGYTCKYGTCVLWDERCQPPLRLAPDRGPATGGTIITVVGGEFYIGAMEWWAVIGEDTFIHPVGYDGGGYMPCALTFITPPMPAGTYEVHAFYGWPPFDEPRPDETSAGTFTFEAYDGQVGHGFCRSDHQCQPYLEACDLGTGRCVPAVCSGLVCDDWSAPCDHIEGCLDPAAVCETTADCKLIYSSCGCHAVHISDPRSEITSCALGGCEVCSRNHCDAEHILPACLNGVCVEVRGDPGGLNCRLLEPRAVAGTLQSDGWIRGVSSAGMGDKAALAWTQPGGEPHYRYGDVRAALVDVDGRLSGSIANLSPAYTRDSNPAVAADGGGYGVAWIVEQSGASVAFQRFDLSGSPAGETRTVATDLYATITPRMLTAPGGFDLFFGQDSYYSGDGLYHAQLSAQGDVQGGINTVDWMIPDSGQMDVVRHRDRFAVAWRNKVGGFDSLYWTEYPLSEAVVFELAGEGSEVVMASTGQGFGVVWRESHQGTGSAYSTLHFQSFDQDGRPLTDPIQMAYNRPLAFRPRLSYLGGVFLLTWMEQDGYEDDQPGRIKYVQFTETGARVVQPQELSTTLPPPADLFHVPFEDSSSILVGTVESGATADAIRFTRFVCVQ